MAKPKGITIGIGADASEFKKEIKEIGKGLSQTQRDVNQLARGLKLEFDNNSFLRAQKLTQQAIEQTETKAKKLRERIQELEQAGQMDTTHYKWVQSELVKTDTQAKRLKQTLEEINQTKINNIGKNLQDLGGSLEKAGRTLAPVSAAAAGVVAGLGAAGKSAVDAGTEIKKLSDQLGLSAEEMQRWQYVAKQTNVEQTHLVNAFKKTQLGLAQMTKGEVSNATKALGQLGIGMEQAARGMEANIDIVIGSLANMQDPLQRVAIATQLFGDDVAANLIPMLKGGTESLESLTKEFKALGYLTNNQINNLSGFNNEITRTKTALANLKNELGAAMLPVMETFADILNNKIIPAMKQVVDWFAGLSDGTKTMIVTILAATAALAPLLMLGGKLLTGLGSLKASLAGLKTALAGLMANPIVAIVAVISALLVLLYSKNEAFRNSVNNLVQTLGSALQPILEVLGVLLKEIFKAIDPIIQVLGNVLAPVIDLLSASLGFQTKIMAEQAKLIGGVLVPVVKLLGGAFEFVGKIVEKVFMKIMATIESVINWVIDKVNWLIEKLNAVVEFFGGTGLKTIEKIDITGKTIEKTTENLGNTTNEVVNYGGTTGTYDNRIYNTDNSTKNITLELVVNNYGDPVDPDELVNEINRRLAEAM